MDPVVYYIGATVLGAIGASWSLAWWFARQFAIVINSIYETKDSIISKLEYHEKHDDVRFANVDKNIWELRLHMEKSLPRTNREEIIGESTK
jgi:hypothetical protein